MAVVHTFYVYNPGETPDEIRTFGTFRVAAEDAEITNVTFTDGNGKLIQNVADYLKQRESEEFVTLTANFTYNGPDVAYAFLGGHILTQEGHKEFPYASLNNIILIDSLPYWYVDDIFTFQDFALFNGRNRIPFTLSPSDVLDSAETAMFGVIALTYEEIAAVEEEYLGEDPSFTLDEIPDNIVSRATEKTYTLTANKDVFWNISSVKLNGTASTSDEGEEYDDGYDDRVYLRIKLETVSDDEAAPSDYGTEAAITVNSIVGYTPKGEYEITVQKSTDDGDGWVDAGVLKFTAADDEDNSGSDDEHHILSSSSGCNTGITFFALGIMLSALIFKRRTV